MGSRLHILTVVSSDAEAISCGLAGDVARSLISLETLAADFISAAGDRNLRLRDQQTSSMSIGQ